MPIKPLLRRLARPWAHTRLGQAVRRRLRGSGPGVTRDEVLWCYRQLLGREPESDAAVQAHLGAADFKTLVQGFVASPEFNGQHWMDLPQLRGAAPTRRGVDEAAFRAAVDEYLAGQAADAGLRQYIEMHSRRLADTLNTAQRVLPAQGQTPSRMLDFCAMPFFQHAVQRLLPGVEQTSVRGVNFESDDYVARYGEGRYDLCLNTEVLEHLLFDPSHMVCSINRLLRPGGHLLLSTPNASAAANAVRVLTGQAPSLWNQLNKASPLYYERHNRDWTPAEVTRLLQEHGFEVLDVHTQNYYDSTRQILARHPRLAAWVMQHSTHEHLGDTLFVLARKQREVAAPVHGDWLYVLPGAG